MSKSAYVYVLRGNLSNRGIVRWYGDKPALHFIEQNCVQCGLREGSLS